MLLSFLLSLSPTDQNQIKGSSASPEITRPAECLINYGSLQPPLSQIETQISNIITLKTPLHINQL